MLWLTIDTHIQSVQEALQKQPVYERTNYKRI